MQNRHKVQSFYQFKSVLMTSATDIPAGNNIGALLFSSLKNILSKNQRVFFNILVSVYAEAIMIRPSYLNGHRFHYGKH